LVADRSVITGVPGAAAIIKWKLDVAVYKKTHFSMLGQVCSHSGAIEEGCGAFVKAQVAHRVVVARVF